MGRGAGGDPPGPAGPAQPPDSPGGPECVYPHLCPPDSTCLAANPGCELGLWGNELRTLLSKQGVISAHILAIICRVGGGLTHSAAMRA